MTFSNLIFYLIILLFHFTLSAQTVQGVIKKLGTDEPLPFVTVKTKNEVVISNKYGFYSINISKNESIIFSAIGDQSEIIKGVACDSLINIEMVEREIMLEDINVLAEKPNEMFNGTNISIQKIKEMPTLFGESDIIKSLAFLPGVVAISEASSGFSVRGGASNQNLILLDNAPVYNLSHLFGLFSVLNPDAIKSLQFYKSYIPARFGGRLSSILDVDLYDGNTNRVKKELSIGLISSRFKLDGPIKQNTTFSLALRSSYLSLFLLPSYFSFKNSGYNEFFNYWLYDVNAKIKTKINDKATFTYGFYFGKDYWISKYGNKLENTMQKTKWGNLASTAKIEWILTPKIFSTSNLILSTYNQKISTIGNFENKILIEGIGSELVDIGLKQTFDYYYKNNIQFIGGFDIIRHKITPSYLTPSTGKPVKIGIETTQFLEIKLGNQKKINTTLGVRSLQYLIDENYFNRLEPRLGLSLKLNKFKNISISYTQNNQFIHQISSNTVGLPLDIWISSGKSIDPEKANQYSISFNSRKSTIEWQNDFFYKSYNRLLDINNGVSLYNLGSSKIESYIKNGIGFSSGIENHLIITKSTYSFDFAYTLSVSKIKIEGINNNQWYFSAQDRRHVLTSNGVFQIKPNRIKIGVNFILYSGTPTTVPDGVINLYRNETLKNYPFFIYNERNNFRMPLYHRADVNLIIQGKTKFHKEKTTTIGIYNIYNRANPFYLDIKTSNNYNNYRFNIVKVGILPILPYISYNFKW
jgi:hypothetical protein